MCQDLGQQCSPTGLPVGQDRGTLPVSDKMPCHPGLQCVSLFAALSGSRISGHTDCRPFNLSWQSDTADSCC